MSQRTKRPIRAATIVSRNVASASCRGRQRNSRRAFATSMITGAEGRHPLRLRRQEAQAPDHLRDRVDGELGDRDRVPPELPRELRDGQPTGSREVVDAGRPAAEHGGAHRARHVVVARQLEGHARIGEHRLEDRHAVEQTQDRAGQALGDLRVGQAVDQQRRVAAADDAGTKDEAAVEPPASVSLSCASTAAFSAK